MQPAVCSAEDDMIKQQSVRNNLLRMMSSKTFRALFVDMRRMELPVRHVLVESNRRAPSVCFLESGLASMVATGSDGQAIEIGHIGREGAAGMHVAMMVATTPNRTFMQIAGDGIMVDAELFERALAADTALRRLCLNYVHTTELQLAHSALANGRFSVNQRLARWILMCHDRVDGDGIPVTHDFLSLMLGVRRAGVTDAIHVLEGMGGIKSTRGLVHVVHREKLLEIADGCYGAPEREYQRVFENIPQGNALYQDVRAGGEDFASRQWN
jgi:CRP-like cAMP-binding protein